MKSAAEPKYSYYSSMADELNRQDGSLLVHIKNISE